MIRITVEMESARGREFDRLLGVGIISNVGGDATHGDYSVWLSKMAPRERQAWKEGRMPLTADEVQHFFDTDVTHFDREKRGCWDLIYIALRQLVAGRNPEPAPPAPIVESTRIRRVRRP